jgi:hypothetical protein
VPKFLAQKIFWEMSLRNMPIPIAEAAYRNMIGREFFKTMYT